MDPLVAEPQSPGELPKGCAAQVQAAYRPMELGASNLGIVFRLDEMLLCPFGLRE